MRLFLVEGRPDTDRMVKAALGIYAAGKDTEVKDARVERSEDGKPFFAGFDGVHFSVSHSGGMWVCLMAASEVGIDIQEARAVRSARIAERFFTPGESRYTKASGDEGFMDIWVRKEAVVKCLGIKLMSGIGSIAVADEGRLLDEINAGGKRILIREIDMGKYVRCAYALEADGREEDAPPEITFLPCL